eukprot:6087925-Lingulodinium_polyedra.AAC.1
MGSTRAPPSAAWERRARSGGTPACPLHAADRGAQREGAPAGGARPRAPATQAAARRPPWRRRGG